MDNSCEYTLTIVSYRKLIVFFFFFCISFALFLVAFGYRSPSAAHINIGGGNTSPGQGRSLREYDEKLNALQKENFNLKLRLFFLEENSPATGGNGNGATKNAEEESLFKQNIDLKVENEELRKELQSKQELLMQAAKVMELMEETQRKSEDKSSSIIADLSNKNQSLEVNGDYLIHFN